VIEHVDAVIIGTGQAGKPLAGALAEARWRTAIIERGRVGGTCIIDGCTPTKTMIASARVAQLARRASDYGVAAGTVTVDMTAVRERKRSVVNSFSSASERGLRRHETLELVEGAARFEGPRRMAVDLADGGIRRFEARYVFINSGTRPKVPQLRGLTDVPYLDNASVMELDEVPAHLVVLGGGFVGLEFAQMFRRFGAQVTLIEQGPRIAKREDDDVSSALAKILADEGITIRTGTRVDAVRRYGEEIVATISSDGREQSVSGSHLLIAVGRTPNTDALDLPSAGIATDERGYIRVNDRLETNVPGVYALGEVNGGPPFTHVSYDDFRVVRANLLGGGPERTVHERLTPFTLYTDPQLGRVGLTEREARKLGHDVRIARLSMSRVARAIETGETAGLMKAVVDGRSERILGAAVLGLEGGETLALIQTAMMGGLPYNALRDGVYAHPTLAESVNNLFKKLE
jgi:pyruvate/2-oxoglutarate dehydrogenase complex dihydrolipoamide dehydrogenase (E3) component